MDEIIIIVTDEFSSQRIDKALSSLTDFTRSHIQRILENGEVTVGFQNGVLNGLDIQHILFPEVAH